MMLLFLIDIFNLKVPMVLLLFLRLDIRVMRIRDRLRHYLCLLDPNKFLD